MSPIKKPNAILRTTIGGRYRFIVRRPDGTVRLETDWVENLITDIGMDRIGQGLCCDYCRVGTSNATPANTDQALGAQIASSVFALNVAGLAAQATAPYYGYLQMVYTFAQGSAAGNLNEVGVGWSSGGNTLFSRALTGSTITVLSDEILTVVYQLRLYPPLSDVTGTVSIASVNRDFVVRASSVQTTAWAPVLSSTGVKMYFNGAVYVPRSFGSGATLGAITGIPSGGVVANFGSVSDAAYTSGTHYRDGTILASITDANSTGGVVCVDWQHGLGRYQCSFDPLLAKDNTKTLSLTFRHTWARH